ncbi:cullin-5-like isoform X3 [Adelges cooleyi]|uniref:cullin-5-like isoform X3 n=1 Tax=Adelges cooleyi TaxID=133065 RepID=UPI0021805CC0|nr:cullin-5-like isoform X3 [Adelges cooleyi]
MTTFKMLLDSWSQTIFNDIKQKLHDSAMDLLYRERNGEAFDSQLFIDLKNSYVNLSTDPNNKLNIYRKHFEKAYMISTEAFYKVKAPEYLELHGAHDYIKYACAKIREEEVRAQKYLESSTGFSHKITDCCVTVLVSTFQHTILAECTNLIKKNDTEMLKHLFKLVEHLPDCNEIILEELEEHITSEGLAYMVSSANIITQDSEKYVEQLLFLYRKSSNLIKTAFNDDPRYLTARDKAYEQLVNDITVFRLELPVKQTSGVQYQPESKCPEMLANYCDMLLRKTSLSKRLTSDEIEAKLKDILLILKYIQNKDVFMKIHKAHLTRRLILDISADSEKEENMVNWLREIGMPADYINKLARMFQDIKVSEDLNQEFKESCSNLKGKIAGSLNIKILNAGAWSRGSERVTVSLPVELEDYIPEVEEFYRKKHTGRKLQWYHHMSNGTITFNNEIGQFDIDVTTFQMAVLFSWNQRPKGHITYENLKLATELPDPDLRRTLWSLVAFPKLKKQVVMVSPDASSPNDFSDSTTFWINEQFSIVKNGKIQKRGKLSMIGRLQLSTERSKEEDSESIVQLRIFRIQEAIIKILKMRKEISNWNLQTELVLMLKNMFIPNKKMIKEQIEWLIEQKYIKRNEDNINTFVYIS